MNSLDSTGFSGSFDSGDGMGGDGGDSSSNLAFVFQTHPMVVDRLVPSLISLYNDIEYTEREGSFYFKFHMRATLGGVLQYLWGLPQHRRVWLSFASKDGFRGQYLKFANMLMNDATYLLDEALSHLRKIRELDTKQEALQQWEKRRIAQQKQQQLQRQQQEQQRQQRTSSSTSASTSTAASTNRGDNNIINNNNNNSDNINNVNSNTSNESQQAQMLSQLLRLIAGQPIDTIASNPSEPSNRSNNPSSQDTHNNASGSTTGSQSQPQPPSQLPTANSANPANSAPIDAAAEADQGEYRNLTMAQVVEALKEVERDLSSSSRIVSGLLHSARSVIAILGFSTREYWSCQTFLLPEMVGRLADTLNYFLKFLTGPERKQLRVKQGEKRFRFNPRALLRGIIVIYLNVYSADVKGVFSKAIGEDARSFHKDMFSESAAVLSKSLLLSAGEEQRLRALSAAATSAFEAQEAAAAAEEDEDVPEHLLCSITYCVLEDPVELPTSGHIVSKAAIARHLLTDTRDPFNRSPLNIDMVVPRDDLVAEIKEWRRQKREAAKAKEAAKVKEAKEEISNANEDELGKDDDVIITNSTDDNNNNSNQGSQADESAFVGSDPALVLSVATSSSVSMTPEMSTQQNGDVRREMNGEAVVDEAITDEGATHDKNESNPMDVDEDN